MTARRRSPVSSSAGRNVVDVRRITSTFMSHQCRYVHGPCNPRTADESSSWTRFPMGANLVLVGLLADHERPGAKTTVVVHGANPLLGGCVLGPILLRLVAFDLDDER